MSNKKYNFAKILKEYNKKYETTHKLPLEVFDVIIVHDMKTNVFTVTYCNEDRQRKNKKSLQDFTYHHISESLSFKYIKDIILSKEEKTLNLKIEILPASKIKYAYLHNNYYAPGIGQLGKSCMRNKENQRSLNFYVKNNVKIVVLTDDNHKIHARALLWDNVKSTQRKSTFTYLDRVYANSEHHISLFYKLAEKNKWKYYNSISPGNANTSYYKDDIDIEGMYHFPYTDTFRFLYYENNLVFSSKKSKGRYITLTCISGGGYFPELDPNRVQEALSNHYISKKDAIFIKRYEGYVLKKNIADINGDYYSVLDTIIVKTDVDSYILRENATVEVLTNSTIDKSKAIQSDKYKGYIHKFNVVYIGNEIYHKLDADIICFNKKWYHISQCFINYNRKEVNEELAKQPIFFYLYCGLSETWTPHAVVTRKGDLIPKEYAIIAYDLVYNPIIDNIEYQEVYCTNKKNFIQLITGEFILDSSKNRQYLKKFNNKWYIKQEFEAPNKNQLTLF